MTYVECLLYFICFLTSFVVPCEYCGHVSKSEILAIREQVTALLAAKEFSKLSAASSTAVSSALSTRGGTPAISARRPKIAEIRYFDSSLPKRKVDLDGKGAGDGHESGSRHGRGGRALSPMKASGGGRLRKPEEKVGGVRRGFR